MNENMKYGLFFLGGLALGAIGAVAVSKGKLDLKPVAADLLSRGMDVKDAVLAKVETVKENMDDMVAEARHAAEQRREYVHDPLGPATQMLAQPFQGPGRTRSPRKQAIAQPAKRLDVRRKYQYVVGNLALQLVERR